MPLFQWRIANAATRCATDHPDARYILMYVVETVGTDIHALGAWRHTGVRPDGRTHANRLPKTGNKGSIRDGMTFIVCVVPMQPTLL
ncbi:MAG: hypothetical protein P4L71_06140 [Acetobacteraceae bacterium]|nr:hypothetical protein [Acetobacteraceae bacterium]